MNRRSRRTLVRAVLVILAGSLLVLVLAPAIGAASTPASVLNPGPEGSRTFGNDLAPAPLLHLGSVTGEEGAILLDGLHREDLDGAGSLVVVGPQERPTASEAGAIRSFVDGGGRLVLLDDGPHGNAYISAAGGETRIQSSPLRDLAYQKGPAFPVVTDLATQHPVTRNVDRLVLNHGSALVPGSQTETLAETSDSSWIDADADDRPDPNEEKGPFPVVVEEEMGSGAILVLGDASLVSEAMRGVAGNADLAANLVGYADEPVGSVLVDEAHRGALDPLGALPVPRATVAALVLATAGLLAVEPGITTGALRRLQATVGKIVSPPREDPHETLVEAALDRNPDWDEKRLRDLVAAWEGDHDGG